MLMEGGHISKVGAGLQSLKQIIPLLMADNVHSLCLHCNEISKIECLSHLQALKDLNLSANAITDIEGLQNLRSLTSLNLASNRIQVLNGLQGLGHLQSLNLAHNFISTLSGLTALQVPPPMHLQHHLCCSTSVKCFTPHASSPRCPGQLRVLGPV